MGKVKRISEAGQFVWLSSTMPPKEWASRPAGSHPESARNINANKINMKDEALCISPFLQGLRQKR